MDNFEKEKAKMSELPKEPTVRDLHKSINEIQDVISYILDLIKNRNF